MKRTQEEDFPLISYHFSFFVFLFSIYFRRRWGRDHVVIIKKKRAIFFHLREWRGRERERYLVDGTRAFRIRFKIQDKRLHNGGGGGGGGGGGVSERHAQGVRKEMRQKLGACERFLQGAWAWMCVRLCVQGHACMGVRKKERDRERKRKKGWLMERKRVCKRKGTLRFGSVNLVAFLDLATKASKYLLICYAGRADREICMKKER